MKALEVARRRMHNSRLLGRPFDTPEDAVRWHGAMQAQDYGYAKWSIAQRSRAIVGNDVDDSLARGAILRTHVLRPTWHFVARDDLRWLLALTGPRVHRHNGPRYRELELTERMLNRCQRLIASALEGGLQLTRSQIASLLDSSGVDRSGQRLAYILMYCELEGVICSGGLADKQHTYALVDERVENGPHVDRDEALVELTRRYLTSHGPASVQDLRWWSSLTVADIKKAFDALGPELKHETIQDITLWSIASHDDRLSTSKRAHLLQAYDEFIVGYGESRYIGDPRADRTRAVWTDRNLPNGVVLLNGRLAGHWRRTPQKNSVAIKVLTYEEPSAVEVRALKTAAAELSRFLGSRPKLEIAPI